MTDLLESLIVEFSEREGTRKSVSSNVVALTAKDFSKKIYVQDTNVELIANPTNEDTRVTHVVDGEFSELFNKLSRRKVPKSTIEEFFST